MGICGVPTGVGWTGATVKLNDEQPESSKAVINMALRIAFTAIIPLVSFSDNDPNIDLLTAMRSVLKAFRMRRNLRSPVVTQSDQAVSRTPKTTNRPALTTTVGG